MESDRKRARKLLVIVADENGDPLGRARLVREDSNDSPLDDTEWAICEAAWHINTTASLPDEWRA